MFTKFKSFFIGCSCVIAVFAMQTVSYADIKPVNITVKEQAAIDPVEVPLTAVRDLSDYELGPGDSVKITVFGERDLTNIYAVNDSGIISVPLIGEIDVSGMTVFEVKNILVEKFSEGYLKDPSIAIEVDEFRPFYILGEVRDPGSYDFVSNMSILKAVAIAGGFTYRANTKKVEILRGGDGKSIHMEDINPKEKIRPGDIILIKERFF